MNDYDTAWKRAIRYLFYDFLAACWASAYALVDRTRAPEFLEQELPQGAPHACNGKRVADIVARVATLSGRPMILHIEVQHRKDRYFNMRMCSYHSRLLDKHACPVHSMAVIADDGRTWRPGWTTIPQLDGGHEYRFPIFKVADYQDQVDALLNDGNPFAFFIAIHLLNRRTRRNPQERLQCKCRTIERLYAHKAWGEKTIGDLLSLIDWLMEVPRELQAECNGQIAAIERRYNMELMPRFAYDAMKEGRRLGFQLGREEGREEGREKGREEGREEGREKGRLEGQRDLLREQLCLRFGALPEETNVRLSQAGAAELQRWARALCNADALGDVFR
ncbi:MAG: hypothetical protein K0R43_4182 [Pseudoduganella sp.]|nr:hypothetical protein [Pseudoduganella sp.]